jgi:transcriptional regulator with XRE-family HTH domain
MKTVVIKNETLPMFLPNGWKSVVAKRIGVHYASMSRILKNKKSPNYAKAVKVARELYGE